MDNYVTGYPVLICAMLEAIAIGWIYGIDRLKKDLKLMSGSYPNMYWIICFLILTPFFTALGVILSIIGNSEVMLNDYHYPTWAHGIGWLLVILVLSPLGIVFVQQLIANKFNLKSLFEPSPDWLPALPLSGEDIMDTDYNGSDSDDKEMNIEQVAASNMILLSNNRTSKHHGYDYSRSDSWKKHTTEL